MTNEQKYSEVLKELGALLADKNATISSQKWQINQLNEKLKKAEQDLFEATQNTITISNELMKAVAEIEILKGGAV